MADSSLRASEPTGSSEPAAAAQTRPFSGLKDECSSGGACAAVQGVVAGEESDPGEKKADREQFLKPPDIINVNKNVNPHETMTGVATRKKNQENPNLGKSPIRFSPRRVSPWKSSPRKDRTLNSFNFSPKQLIPTPRAKRRSWCRSSLKGTKRRKSLPPVYQDVTELSKFISLDLPEIERLSILLLSSFQFSAQKLEDILKQTDDFNPEAFRANAQSVSEDLKRYMQKLKRDGTLKSCVEDPQGILLDSALEESVAQVKEYITRFTAESRSWDQLLLRHQESAEEMSRQLEECKRNGGEAEPLSYLQTSQTEVLGSKPNYQKILDDQGEVLSCMELVLDELQQGVKLLQAFSEDSQHYLRGLSEQLATRTFQQLENSPVRKLIAAAPRRALPPEG